MKDFLPIGSIVLLKEGTRKLMITGILTAIKDQPETVYDYIGVLFPEGFIGDPGNFLFNHDDINDIIFTGYSNPEREEFIRFVKQKMIEAAEADEDDEDEDDEGGSKGSDK